MSLFFLFTLFFFNRRGSTSCSQCVISIWPESKHNPRATHVIHKISSVANFPHLIWLEEDEGGKNKPWTILWNHLVRLLVNSCKSWSAPCLTASPDARLAGARQLCAPKEAHNRDGIWMNAAEISSHLLSRFPKTLECVLYPAGWTYLALLAAVRVDKHKTRRRIGPSLEQGSGRCRRNGKVLMTRASRNPPRHAAASSRVRETAV